MLSDQEVGAARTLVRGITAAAVESQRVRLWCASAVQVVVWREQTLPHCEAEAAARTRQEARSGGDPPRYIFAGPVVDLARLAGGAAPSASPPDMSAWAWQYGVTDRERLAVGHAAWALTWRRYTNFMTFSCRAFSLPCAHLTWISTCRAARMKQRIRCGPTYCLTTHGRQ